MLSNMTEDGFPKNMNIDQLKNISYQNPICGPYGTLIADGKIILFGSKGKLNFDPIPHYYPDYGGEQ